MNQEYTSTQNIAATTSYCQDCFREVSVVITGTGNATIYLMGCSGWLSITNNKTSGDLTIICVGSGLEIEFLGGTFGGAAFIAIKGCMGTFTTQAGTWALVRIEGSTVKFTNNGTITTLEDQTVSFDEGVVFLDALLGTAGTAYPIGTALVPAANIADAIAIATANNLVRIRMVPSAYHLITTAGAASRLNFEATMLSLLQMFKLTIISVSRNVDASSFTRLMLDTSDVVLFRNCNFDNSWFNNNVSLTNCTMRSGGVNGTGIRMTVADGCVFWDYKFNTECGSAIGIWVDSIHSFYFSGCEGNICIQYIPVGFNKEILFYNFNGQITIGVGPALNPATIHIIGGSGKIILNCADSVTPIVDGFFDRISFTTGKENALLCPIRTEVFHTGTLNFTLFSVLGMGSGQITIGQTIMDGVTTRYLATQVYHVILHSNGTHSLLLASNSVITNIGGWGTKTIEIVDETILIAWQGASDGQTLTANASGTLAFDLVNAQVAGMDTDTLTADALAASAIAEMQIGVANADDMLLVKKSIVNKKTIEKISGEYYLCIYDDDDNTKIVEQLLLTFDEETLGELAGTTKPSIRLKSSLLPE